MKRISTRLAALALASLAAVAVLGGSAAAQSTPATAPAGDAARGKTQFMAYGCYECHGTVAQGNLFGMPHLAPHPLPYTALLAYIRRPAGQMPSYSAAILPDKDAADIYAYLTSLPATKPVGSIPALAGIVTKPK